MFTCDTIGMLLKAKAATGEFENVAPSQPIESRPEVRLLSYYYFAMVDPESRCIWIHRAQCKSLYFTPLNAVSSYIHRLHRHTPLSFFSQ